MKYEAPTGLETWGQLLEVLEHGDGPAHMVVTAVRFGGVDEPSFREAAALARVLETGQEIDIDTCEAGELVASAIEVARQGLGPLAEAARQTAERFRSRDVVTANRGLADFALTLKMLGSLTAAVRHQAGASGVQGAEARATDFLEDLGISLESLIEANSSKDWILVADMLEYEIPDLLARWNEMLGALGQSHAAAGRPLAS